MQHGGITDINRCCLPYPGCATCKEWLFPLVCFSHAGARRAALPAAPRLGAGLPSSAALDIRNSRFGSRHSRVCGLLAIRGILSEG